MPRLNDNKKLSIWRPIQPQALFLDEYTNIVKSPIRDADRKVLSLKNRLRGNPGLHHQITSEELEKEIKQGNRLLQRLLVTLVIALNIYVGTLIMRAYSIEDLKENHTVENLYYSTKEAFFNNLSGVQSLARHALLHNSL